MASSTVKQVLIPIMGAWFLGVAACAPKVTSPPLATSGGESQLQTASSNCCYYLRTSGEPRCTIVEQCVQGGCPAKLVEGGGEAGFLFLPAKPVSSCANHCPELAPEEKNHPVCD